MKFRRQHPVGTFIVDFVAVEERVVLELDGGQHARGGARIRDAERSRDIERLGFRVLRFWNSDVLQNLDGVLSAVTRALERIDIDGDSPPYP